MVFHIWWMLVKVRDCLLRVVMVLLSEESSAL
jgi:hypothetical protein